MLRYLVRPAPLYGATHDDELMVRLASEILDGRWLGDYSNLGHLTLSKPPGYPLFLAWTHFLPWAPTITVHLILLFGIFLVAREFRAMKFNRTNIYIFVLLSSFHPQWFSFQFSRIYRDGFLSALTFLGLGVSLWLGRLIIQASVNEDQSRNDKMTLLGVGLLNGFVLSWTIATKPGWWPIGASMFLIALRGFKKSWKVIWKHQFKNFAIAGSAFLIGLVSIIGYISYQNKANYGVFQLDTFSTGWFPKALNKWSSVKSDDQRKYILVDATQRERIYKVSPLAKKLKPYLEQNWANGWRGSSCISPMKLCDESSAWFVWDFRDAVHSAGLDSSAKEFENTFRQLTHELSKACEDKKIECGAGGLAPGLVPFKDMSKRELIDGYGTAIDWIISNDVGSTMRGGIPEDTPSYYWNNAINGLPALVSQNVYRPETADLGNVILLLQRIYNLFIPILLVLTIVGLLINQAKEVISKQARLVSLFCLLGATLFIGQLDLLEVSSGMYLLTGRALYMLAVLPFILVFIGIEISNFSFLKMKKPIDSDI